MKKRLLLLAAFAAGALGMRAQDVDVSNATKDNPVDVTNKVVNPNFDTNADGWTSDTGAQNTGTTANKEGDFTGDYWENWNPDPITGRMYQTIKELPAGTYGVRIAAFAEGNPNPISTSVACAVYAQVEEGVCYRDYIISNIPTFYTAFAYVSENKTLEIGLRQDIAKFNWLGIDNVTLQYYGTEDVAEELMIEKVLQPKWDNVKNEVGDLLQNPEYTNVQGKERADLVKAYASQKLSTVEEYDEFIKYIEAFVSAKPNYDLYVAEKKNAERISESIVVEDTPTTAAEADAAVKALIVAEYNYVKATFNADAAAKYDITIDKWTGTATSGGDEDTPQTRDNEKWGASATTYYEQGGAGWGSSAWTLNYTKTVTLPKGAYVLKLAARAELGVTAALKATVGETTITEPLPNVGAYGKGITTSGVASYDEGDFARNGEGYGWQWRFLAFTLEEEGEVTLQIDAYANTMYQWCSFGDVAVLSYVNTEELKKAVEEYQVPTLGFEAGEYAPYNNVANLEAYEKGKAIVDGKTLPDDQADVDNLVAVLNTESEWIANKGSVDAVYNGNFSEGLVGNVPIGWTRTNAWGMFLDDVPKNFVSSGTAYYNQAGTMKYGDNGIYTMPLDGNTIYHLVVKYGKWDQDVTPSVSILNADQQGMQVQKFAATSVNYKDELQLIDMVIVTGDHEGKNNYVLSVNGDKNLVMTGISLKKAEEQVLVFADDAVPAYAPGTYPAVKIDREFTGNWATAVYPFAVSGDDLTVAQLGELTDDAVLKFTTADASEANVPFLLKATAEGITLENVEVSEATVQDAAIDNVTLKGTYEETTVKADEAEAYVYYVLSNNQLHKIGATAATVPVYRAWLEIAADALSSEAGLRIAFDDGEATAIEAVMEQSGVNDGKIYDLSGRAVSAPTRGLYIINGKKVMVK